MMRNPFIYSLILIFSCTVQASPGEPPPADKKPTINSKPDKTPPKQVASRGQLLYQNHCTVCHESNVHIRNKRKARTLTDITMWVSKWSEHRDLRWTTDEIKAVRDYLNQTYYKFTR